MSASLAIKLVQYGVAGVAVIAMMLTFNVIKAEQKRPTIRANFLKVLWIYTGVVGGCMTLLFVLEIMRWNRPIDPGALRHCRTSINELSIELQGLPTDQQRAHIAEVSEACEVLWEQIDASL
ncbi:MAG TPA: hypothetical protein VK034_29630 [Enhygromyxa sp.]|nr:hypothetical protein [Enhygromyxa sp.]